jgi:transporter family protein
MERWLGYALLSALFAGMTSVIAKLGLTGISGDLGLTLRTCFVFVFVLVFAAAVVPRAELQSVTAHNILWLALSAAATAASWICYYRAVKLGEVSTVALIDKASVLVALALAIIVLKETLTVQKVLGSAFIIAGMLLIARR